MEEEVKKLGMTLEDAYKQACQEHTAMKINPDIAWGYYLKTGFIPFFVRQFIEERANVQQPTPRKTP